MISFLIQPSTPRRVKERVRENVEIGQKIFFVVV
jgi:hypothetical protein